MTDLITSPDRGMLTLTTNRPASRNTVAYALLDAFAAAGSDEAVRRGRRHRRGWDLLLRY